MIFHFGADLPDRRVQPQKASSDSHQQILRQQIRKNSILIQEYIDRLDIIVNQEMHPRHQTWIEDIRKRLYLLMDENDTFRKSLWKHTKSYT